MVPFFAIGGVVAVSALVAMWRRQRMRRLPAAPEGIVYMDESVLNAFLIEDHDRRPKPQPKRGSKRPTASATDHDPESDSATPTDATSDGDKAARGAATERFVSSTHGGGTVVAGPPIDLADEGWAPDPEGHHEWRYFDASGWSDYVLDGDEVATDPLDVAPSASDETADADRTDSDADDDEAEHRSHKAASVATGV